MSKTNILKISLPLILFIVFLNFSFSQDFSSSISVNIEWQALDSYTPNFYKGRALPGEEAYMKAVAIVEANSLNGSINSDSFYYSWRYNDYYLYNNSGTGVKTVYFTLDKLQSNNVLELSIYSDSSQSTLLGKKAIQIKPTPVLPILYKRNSNGLITYANAINKKYQDLNVNSGDSFSILAEPYFFSAKNTLDPILSYSWTADGIFNGNINSNIFNYYSSGVNNLSLKINNNQKILQEGETSINFSVK